MKNKGYAECGGVGGGGGQIRCILGNVQVANGLFHTDDHADDVRYPNLGSGSDKLKICFIVITLFSRSLR